MKNEGITLATEMMQELKRNSKRWFIVSIIELIVIIAITAMFVWYLYIPEEEIDETTSYEQEANTQGDYSTITQQIGE